MLFCIYHIYSVSGLFVPFVKDPSALTREVSSAYVMNLKIVLACEKSLIYIMNNRAPSIEPYGTPVGIGIGKAFNLCHKCLQIAYGLLSNSLIRVMLMIPAHNLLIF